jgi:hypothetical protein
VDVYHYFYHIFPIPQYDILLSFYGVHEQWVYGNGKYIYFDNGVVTTIQKTK